MEREQLDPVQLITLSDVPSAHAPDIRERSQQTGANLFLFGGFYLLIHSDRIMACVGGPRFEATPSQR